MAITTLKLQPADFAHHRIADLADKPGQAGMNANALKAAFDAVAINILAPRINDILDALAATGIGNSGAHSIGSAAIAGVSGATVFEQLADLKALIDKLTDVAVGGIPLDSITDDMLKAGGVKDQFATHAASVGAHFVTGQTTGTAAAFVLADAAHPWATISTGPCLFLVKPHADCAANPTISLCGGPATAIYPGTGGGLDAGQMKANGMYLLMWSPASGLVHLLNPEYPAALLLDRIKAVDGGSSGLDADTVDGLHATDLLRAVYPVGSIYMNTIATNPATLFGFGTWVSWGSGRVPVGVDTAQTEFNAAEKTGGEKNHQISIQEMPSHTHNPKITILFNGNAGNYRSLFATNSDWWQTNGDPNNAVDPTGGGQAHNNLQPYVTCYMWKRTA